jgi:hypothetical protein
MILASGLDLGAAHAHVPRRAARRIELHPRVSSRQDGDLPVIDRCSRLALPARPLDGPGPKGQAGALAPQWIQDWLADPKSLPFHMLLSQLSLKSKRSSVE